MCGISAVIETGTLSRPLYPLLAGMHQALAHRGPDGEGYLWLDAELMPTSARGNRLAPPMIPAAARAAAAFRWLRIQDLDERSNQPMSSADGRHWILFNGEIYNHGTLREELVGLGEAFVTRSDTEVALAAFRRWGLSAFSRFHGMWAIVLFDTVGREVILSRDRLGIKPLYYAFDGTLLRIASEPKAIVRSAGFAPRAEPFRVHEFLRGLPPQSAELSFFEDVHPIPSGTWAAVPLDGRGVRELTPQRFWDLAGVLAEDTPEEAFEQKREEFEALLVDALESHADAAVHVGALLSGGLDTSILARLLANHAARKGSGAPKTFSIVFADPAMSEWPYMQLVLAKGGLQGFNRVLTADAAWDSTGDVVEAQGQPLLGQDTIAQFHAYRLAREHDSIVVIEGQGSDEMLAGMPAYDAQIFPEMLRTAQLVRYAQEFRARVQANRMTLRQAASVFLVGPYRRRRMEDRGLPRYPWLDSDGFDSTRFGHGRTDDWGPDASALNRFLYRHVRHTNLPAALMYQDRSAMANGIESRVPFLDHRLVEFAFRLPERFKVHLGVRKRILLETARKYLPAAVVGRRDKRIFISRTGWMELRRGRAAELRAMAASPEFRDFALLRPPRVAAFVEAFLAGRNNDEMAVWRLYTLWHWLRRFRPAL